MNKIINKCNIDFWENKQKKILIVDDSNFKETILIVDDEIDNLNFLIDILKKDYNISVAQNGNDALSLINSKNFDLILLDIKLPDISGYEICRKLKSNNKFNEIPVIFLSGSNNEEAILKGFDVGGVSYLTKPCIIKEVQQTLRTHIDLYKTNANSQQYAKELQISNYKHNLEIIERLKIENKLIESENDYKTLFDNFSDALCLIDLKGNILKVNKNTCNYTEYSEKELLKMNAVDIDAPEYFETAPQRLKKIIENEQYIFEIEHITKSGKRVPIEVNAKLFEYKGMTVILGIERDISQRKQ